MHNHHQYKTNQWYLLLCLIIETLSSVNSKDFLLPGRIPKIGNRVELSILEKILGNKPLKEYIFSKGDKVYYRSSGGRYFKIVTDYSTGSNKEKSFAVASIPAGVVAVCLSSNLSFWFYQIYSNNLDWKSEEILSFPMPSLNASHIKILQNLYLKYSQDIEQHAQSRIVSKNSKYTMEQFKEYKIGYSKKIIDEIDDFIGPLYGLTKEEIEFIKNYEIEFRMADYLSESELAALSRGLVQGMRLAGGDVGGAPSKTRRSVKVARPIEEYDDEELE